MSQTTMEVPTPAFSVRTETATGCRFCGAPLHVTFADLGMSPMANAYVAPSKVNASEPFYPLHAYVCTGCWLVQLQTYESPDEIFGDYAYFSSYSESWLAHASNYVQYARQRFALGPTSQVIEIASNDGYLLQYFRDAGVPILGIEPARNVALAAIAKGIPTVNAFFGAGTASDLVTSGRQADLLVANNVLAHVPDLNDFVAGMKIVLKADGVITAEFPHLQRLVEQCQFDTIYHEHFSYFSLTTIERVFAHHGLRIFDVAELPTHGGSLRIFACHREDESKVESPNVGALRTRERELGYTSVSLYEAFAQRVVATKVDILDFLIRAMREGKSIAAYGAPAKGNTLLNFCGIRGDMVGYTVDRSPHKQGHYLPGTRIPIHSPDMIAETRPDYLVVLPWNLTDEIVRTMAHIREWGGQFVTFIPGVRVIQ